MRKFERKLGTTSLRTHAWMLEHVGLCETPISEVFEAGFEKLVKDGKLSPEALHKLIIYKKECLAKLHNEIAELEELREKMNDNTITVSPVRKTAMVFYQVKERDGTLADAYIPREWLKKINAGEGEVIEGATGWELKMLQEVRL